ncbi:MAG: metQ [Oscillospiraceae bacterium]|nr:metQ [Oscillospiraceae bacterium]
MKKLLSVLIVSILTLSLFAGCSPKDDKKIVIGASPTPHAEILKVAAEVLKEKGYTLEIKEFADYAQLNPALNNKDIDANYFQHLPFLNDFNEKNKTELVSVASVHYEPLGIYAGKTKTLDALKDNAAVAVPNDTSNEARALLLLETNGLIKLKAGIGVNATIKDITENPKKLQIKELEAAQLARSLSDVDIAVINGNYAIDAGLNAESDALAKEEKSSVAATTYANIVVVRKGDESKEGIKALAEALKSEKVKKYIEDTYKGAVVPVS